MTEALPPECKPLLHRMAVFSGTAFNPPSSILNPHHDPKPTARHVHVNSSNPWHHCPVHGGTRAPQSVALTASYDESSCRTSIACSPRENPHHLDFETDFREGGNGKSFRERRDGKCSWQPENDELKKACEKLCEQMLWKSEKQYQEDARASFREIGQCQAALHAWHDESRRRDIRGATTDDFHDKNNGYRRYRCDRYHLSLGQSHSSFSDVTFARPFRECCKERPVSAPIHERIITSPGRRSLVPEEQQRYSESARPHILKGVNGAYKGVAPRHPSLSLRNERFRSKSVDQKRPRFCTGLKRGKRETDAAAAKKTLNVVPVVMPHRDKTKGVWNRKANQKEWDHGRGGCCSQHWVSVLENNDKVFHADGRKALSARASLSPVPKGKFAAMATQKLKVQGERCHPLVAKSLDLSSSPLSSLKAIVNEMRRPQSASLPKRINSFSTPRSASTTCKKPSIAITPAPKLNNPELNSSAWLLAKMEALRNETFTESKALQIAKEHGIVLDKEDVAALKKYLQSDQSPRLDRSLDAAELEGNKTRENYFNLSNIKLAESAVPARKLKKQLSPISQAARIRKSDPSMASDHNSQVCWKPGDLNMDDAPVFSNESARLEQGSMY